MSTATISTDSETRAGAGLLRLFSWFNELWQRYISGSGAGPAGVYVAGLTEDRREALKQTLRQDILRGGIDGPFTLQAKAWAVRGVVP